VNFKRLICKNGVFITKTKKIELKKRIIFYSFLLDCRKLMNFTSDHHQITKKSFVPFDNLTEKPQIYVNYTLIKNGSSSMFSFIFKFQHFMSDSEWPKKLKMKVLFRLYKIIDGNVVNAWIYPNTLCKPRDRNLKTRVLYLFVYPPRVFDMFENFLTTHPFYTVRPSRKNIVDFLDITLC